jgi:hypothetical protein
MNPANKAVGSLVFKEGKTYFRLYKARNPISGELVYTDYLIDTSIGICVEIQDIEGDFTFKDSFGDCKLTFSDKALNEQKGTDVYQEESGLDYGP